MAKRPAAPTGTHLPRDWRSTWSGWTIWPSLYSIPPDRYETEVFAFERANAGRVSEDWKGDWKAWCRAKLTEPEPITAGMFG